MKLLDTKNKTALFLAPMAGYSDRAMRKVCHECGCEYFVSEMVSAKAVCFGDKKTHHLARILDDEGPTSVQIFGKEPDIMARAAEILQRGEEGGRAPVAIDINMGCPVNKIFSNGEGSALMADPDLIYRIVKEVKSNIDIPCSVKIRAGIDRERRNAVECALAIEEGGADMITVHGRTRVEMYSGKSDRNIIREVKEKVKIPVVANGDIKDAGSAEEMLLATGADGLMIGRASVGNPFLFEEIRSSLDGKAYTPPTVTQKAETALRQLRYAIAEKGENLAVREARKQIALYLRSFRGSARLRAEINTALSYAEVERAIYSFLKEEEA